MAASERRFSVGDLHAAHGDDVALHRPVIALEEVHELALYLQNRGWAGAQCLREAVQTLEAEALDKGRREGASGR